MEKRMLETLMTKEAVEDFGLDVNNLIKVRKRDRTYYAYQEEVSKEVYEEVNREDWKYQKRRQRMFKKMAEKGEMLISLEQSMEDTDFEIESEINVEEQAEKHLMLEALADEIEKLPKEDRKLMKLVFRTDLTQRQLAEILDLSQGAINGRIKKNIKILKEKLIR
ncbi:MAG: sigma-70 family RNA polymerase sigma factor [Peptoniphilaceae bacterium]